MSEVLFNQALHWREADKRIRRWHLQRVRVAHELEELQGCILPATSSVREDDMVGDLPGRVNAFCLQLMDYLFAGHFVIYTQLMTPFLKRGAFHEHPIGTVLTSILQLIESSTDHALGFNDKYDTDPMSINEEPSLGMDVFRLGRVLNARFALEDELLTLAHDQLAARPRGRA